MPEATKPSFLQRLQSSVRGTGGQQQQPPGNQQPGGGQRQLPQGNQPPGNQQQQQDPNNPQNFRQNSGPGQVPGGSQNGGNSGIDMFANMFDNAPTQDGPPAFQIDTDTLTKARKGFNGMQGLDQAVLDKAASGDWPSQLAVMQHMSGGAYEAALNHGSLVTGKYLDARDAHHGKGFDGRVRKAMMGEHLSNKDMPMGARRVMTNIMNRLQQQYPDASLADLEGAAQEMFQDMAQAFNPNAGAQQSGQPGKMQELTEEQWDDFFGSPAPKGASQ